jgi:hypothetical protein
MTAATCAPAILISISNSEETLSADIASASEAIHGQQEKWIASSRSLLAKTARVIHPHLRGLAAQIARVLLEVKPSEPQRAQGMPGARCARSLACKIKSIRVSHHGHAEIIRHSPRNGFTVSFVIFPVIGLCCHRRQ